MKTDLVRRRIASAGAIAAILGTLGYALGRFYFHVIVGASAPSIILREARVNFHLALVIAAFIALVSGVLAAELARTEHRVAIVERTIERIALPMLLVVIALMFLWP
jgi:uncharacterized membrane protein